MYRADPNWDRDGGGDRYLTSGRTAVDRLLCTRSRPASRTAIAVFVDDVDAPWLKFLPRGFRHVFAAVEEGSSWLLCDPLKDRIDLRMLDLPPGADLAEMLVSQGHKVLVGRVDRDQPRQKFAVAPLTCVAVVKRLLGVRVNSVLTPRQLYRHLLDGHQAPFIARTAPKARPIDEAPPYGRLPQPVPFQAVVQPPAGAAITRERA